MDDLGEGRLWLLSRTLPYRPEGTGQAWNVALAAYSSSWTGFLAVDAAASVAAEVEKAAVGAMPGSNNGSCSTADQLGHQGSASGSLVRMALASLTVDKHTKVGMPAS